MALGADCIGMSTVPETIAANYLGMKVLGISCITNMATGIAREKHSHEEVLKIANESGEKLTAWVKGILENW
jgi:purine-nucleoside phosphorylase